MIALKLLVLFFIADFNSLSCEFDSFTLKLCIVSFYIDKNQIIQLHFTKRLQFLVKSPKQFLLPFQE